MWVSAFICHALQRSQTKKSKSDSVSNYLKGEALKQPLLKQDIDSLEEVVHRATKEISGNEKNYYTKSD